MLAILRQDVLTERTALRTVWAVSFLLLAACTAFVLKALPEFGVAASIGLVAAVAAAWVVVGAHVPKLVRA